MVHPTPKKPGEETQTYHVRQVLNHTIHTHDLAEHVSKNSILSSGLFEMVMDLLGRELAEQLLDGRDVHLDGIGRFALQLGTKKVKGGDGRWHKKTYTNPEELTAREVVVEGMTFVPDKKMLNRLRTSSQFFVNEKEGYKQEVSHQDMIKKLEAHCAKHGSFTRKEFQRMFGISRYRAQQLLNDLTVSPTPHFRREKFGSAYIYHMLDK